MLASCKLALVPHKVQDLQLLLEVDPLEDLDFNINGIAYYVKSSVLTSL